MTLQGGNGAQRIHRHSLHRYGNLQGESRKICVENLMRKLGKQTSAAVATKPYSDGEIVKARIVDAVKSKSEATTFDCSLSCLHYRKRNDVIRKISPHMNVNS
ncbi:hypothetical protein T09_1930 [Trichinella sp. T9]|nr:hypothetical protein T09_1930 [Trichinella sp. T9]